MKKVLLPPASDAMHYYRANLHCHSQVSDGRKTVEELKALYRSKGYSVVAFTDHDAFVTHNDLTDKDFLALNGYEVEINQNPPVKTCHMCFIAKEPDNDMAVCYHRSRYIWGNAEKYRSGIRFDESLPDYVRTYDPACINDMIARAKAGGFFVTYNHPTWSLESYPEYIAYEGMDAMEIVNYGCQIEGYDDDNGHAYDDMLRAGKHVFCVATDDNHNSHPDDSPRCDAGGGCTMICAPALTYRTITRALEEGMFYSTTGTAHAKGPEILSLIYEDGQVTVKTTGARMINYIPDGRSCKCAAAHVGESLTEATFRVDPWERWFRIVLIDENGFKAYTRAYFAEELGE